MKVLGYCTREREVSPEQVTQLLRDLRDVTLRLTVAEAVTPGGKYLLAAYREGFVKTISGVEPEFGTFLDEVYRKSRATLEAGQ